MSINPDKSVGEIAAELPNSIPVFEMFGIDYCCGGRKTLEQACSELHLSPLQVLEQLENATPAPADANTADWQAASLEQLAQHIVSKHHKYVRRELVRLEPLANKVRDKHAQKHHELVRITYVLAALRDELSMHMSKEEQILFPYIARLERAAQSDQPASEAPFGRVANPIQVMLQEHDDAASLLRTLREITNQYKVPDDACPSYQVLYEGLQAFEQDLHHHIHLENNILFPRALVLEEQMESQREYQESQ